MIAAMLGIAQAQEPPKALDVGDGVVVMPAAKAPKPAPLFFSAEAKTSHRIAQGAVEGSLAVTIRIHQGNPEVISLALTGEGDVTGVTGGSLKDWSVRTEPNGARFLDLMPVATGKDMPKELSVTVQTRAVLKAGAKEASMLLLGPGKATGFTQSVALEVAEDTEIRVLKADGLVPVEGGRNRRFQGTGAAALLVSVLRGGAAPRELELVDATLVGKATPDGASVSFVLTGEARARKDGATAELLHGAAALGGDVSGAGWHVTLRGEDGRYACDLVAERAGTFPVSIAFEAPVRRKGDWRILDFSMPTGVVVPVRIEGLGGKVSFDRGLDVAPERQGDMWRGFLPASGHANLAWAGSREQAEGALFFSSTEIAELRVGSGLLRQRSTIDFRILQGKLASVNVRLDGAGEILSVQGEQVIGWSVREANGARHLEVKLSRPLEGSGKLVIDAQCALAGFPVKAAPLRFSPEGALRHSGWLRIANEGAVKLEVANAQGMMQLAPAQFPGGVSEGLRQVFVYRFPAASYSYEIAADQVLPEVGVTEVTLYELAETDRRISSDLELDIREAPLREWELMIPADYAVASVTGASVADYAAASEAKDGKRALKIFFQKAVDGRQLISVKLEKNQAAAAGAWDLQPMTFPGAKSRRGYVGAVSAPGFRLVPGKTGGLAEVPLTFFPKQMTGLQQAFRLKDDTWSAGMTVEALGQSVQADVFHLYSLKAGAAYGSVLINYFVVGAPATEWRIAVPKGIGNIEVTGQNVGRDWRRDGDMVIVPLSRPVLGAGTVLLTFEQPMSARGGTLSPGEVHPLQVQSERGYVQVVSPLQVNYEISSTSGPLLKLDASELPAEFRLLTTAPTLAAWQYTARPFAVGMKVEWFEPGDTADQVVDFVKLGSQVSRDGQIVTDARFFVKSRGRSALRMKLPEGAALWDAQVDSVPVNARVDGDETLVPLPAKPDPNDPVEVSLRYGIRAKSARNPHLVAPVLSAPVVISEWSVRGDEGRQLVPSGGTAELVHPVLRVSGFEWLAAHRRAMLKLAALILAALAAGMGAPGKLRSALSVMLSVLLVLGSLYLTMRAVVSIGESQSVLDYASPVVAPGQAVTVEIHNIAPWLANVSWLGVIAVLAGLAVVVRAVWKSCRIQLGAGGVLVAVGVLSQRGGAPLFFVLLTLAVVIALAVPAGRKLWKSFRKTPAAAEPVAAALAIGFVLLTGSPQADAAQSSGSKPAESIVHQWKIADGRLRGEFDITGRGDAGERFLLLRAPAVLSGFTGTGWHVTKAQLDKSDAYFLVTDQAGRFTGHATFEMPLPQPQAGWTLPSGPAAMQKVSVRWNEAGWEFVSPVAAKTEPLAGLAAGESGATLVLGASDVVTIQARARQRDISSEATQYFAEVSNLYLPGPGVANGRHRVVIRPSQGRVTELVLRVPEPFTVGDVGDGPVGGWRFDPRTHELRVSVEPAQERPFAFTVETQRGTDALPVDLQLAPLRVNGAAGEVGLLALAFGDDAQPENITQKGLSLVNLEDFGADLLPRDNQGKSLALVQRVFRYGSADATATVHVAPVAPELRAESREILSLAEDRLVLAEDLAVTITRAGVFRLVLEVPEGLEIEAATGPSLSHWTESKEKGVRLVTLHLNGRTLGRQEFSLSLAGASPGAKTSWNAPRIALREASRETGTLTVVPERGLQVRSVSRRNVSQLDPRELADAPQAQARSAMKTGALAFRLLQGDWTLALAVERLDAWVTAQVLHDVTLREGQMLSRLHISYRIENAALKSLRIRIPGLDATAAATVRATGPAVSDLVPVDGKPGLWEIRFQRGVAGDTSVDIEFQRQTKDTGKEEIQPVVPELARQMTYFVTVRAGGRLELDAATTPRGWQRADWAVVKGAMPQAAGTSVPAMAFRVAEPEGPLSIGLKRHDLAGSLKLRVASGTLTTLVSPDGDALTAVDLQVQVVEKGTLRLRLPKDASLFNVLVNDEGAPLVREGGEWLFYVFPAPEGGRPASVRFVYSAAAGKHIHLEGPALNVPLENLTWRVLVPEGWQLAGHEGDFDLKEEVAVGSFRLEDYQSFLSNKRAEGKKEAVALLDQANEWLRAGDQDKAGQALSKASKTNMLDAASNEDARVQLRQLKTQQAVVGLNTRRQKLYLDNRFEAQQQTDNKQLEQAANQNPVLQGNLNYDPQQLDRLTQGNTADENAALKAIANRIVTQQLAAEPAPVALDVTLPERGTVCTFSRSVQVDGGKAMFLDIKLKPSRAGGFWLGALACLLFGGLVARRKG